MISPVPLSLLASPALSIAPTSSATVAIAALWAAAAAADGASAEVASCMVTSPSAEAVSAVEEKVAPGTVPSEGGGARGRSLRRGAHPGCLAVGSSGEQGGSEQMRVKTGKS